MNFPERIQAWNRAYDALPEDWRFQAVLWPLILLGAINMGLTVAVGFPFGLLVMLALIGLVVVRVPYVLGWVEPASVAGEAVTPRISVSAVPWVYDLNLWYDGLPETRRPWVILVVLVVAGGLNMLLTIHNGFSFGILFLLALLAILLIRAPYAAGWLIPPTAPQARIATAVPHEQITQEAAIHTAPMTIVPPEPAPVAMEAAPPPPVVHMEPPPPVHEEPSPRLDDKPA
jgi:uncharacterized protein (DUF58 family)